MTVVQYENVSGRCYLLAGDAFALWNSVFGAELLFQHP